MSTDSEINTGEISDGFHSFNELYEHRHMLFINLLKLSMGVYSRRVFRTRKHDDGSAIEGWFIAGMETPEGQITYHLPDRLWGLLDGVNTLDQMEHFDGHTANDVVERLKELAK